MKKIVNILVIVFIAAIAGYSAYWYVIANQAEEDFKKYLASWQNEHNSRQFTYDKITKDGFPTHINLRIENPHFSSKELDLKTEGSLSLSVPLWSKERIISLQGDTKTRFFPHSKNEKSIPKLSWNGESTLTLSDHNITHFQILNFILFSSDENIIDSSQISFVSLKNNLNQFSFLNEADEKEPVDVKGGPFEFSVSKRSYGKDQLEYPFSLSQKDLTIQGPPVNSTEIADLGTMNFDFDGSICYPDPALWASIEKAPYAPRDAELCIKLNHLNFQSDIGSSKWNNFILSLKQEQTKWTGIFKLNDNSVLTEKYETLIKKQLAAQLKDPEFKKDILNNNEELYKKIIAHQDDIIGLVPSLETIHKLDSKWDIIGTADVENQHVNKAHLTVNTVEYDVPPYQLSLSGEAQTTDGMQHPTFNGTLKIVNYKQLIEQLSAYANRVIAVYNKIQVDDKTTPPLPIINPASVKSTLAFLQGISDDPNKESSDLKTTVTYSEENQWKIGTLTLNDFLEKFMQVVIAFIQQ